MYPHHLFMYTSYMYSKNPFQVSRTCWKRDDRMRPHVHKTLKSEYSTIAMINLRTNHILHMKVVVWKRYRLTESSVPGRWEAQRSRCMGAMPSLQVEGFLVFAASVSHTWWYPKLAKLVYNLQKMQKLGI